MSRGGTAYPPGGGDHPRLARRLGLADAVIIGLGSMIGAGVFAAFTPAAAAAGSGLLVGLTLAAAVAWANATSSAQLAAQFPESGGTYVYGRECLGDSWGFAAGWAFVVGKTASCAAMAITAATYALGGEARAAQVVGLGIVGALSVVLTRGITKTARLARVLLTVTLACLLVTALVVAGFTREWSAPLAGVGDATAYGILQSAGLLFFAFAGYARIATLGEEVRAPAVTIPRAITRALGLVIALYAALALLLLATIGASGIASSALPLLAAAQAADVSWVGVFVRVGATVAALGALLGLLSGVSRTVLAMARRGDLPRRLAAVDAANQVPAVAQWWVAGAVVALVLLTDLRHAIGFSSFGVLLYYAIANASAWTQTAEHRRWPRWVQGAGLAGCLVLAATLPMGSVLAGALVVGVGVVGRRSLRVRG
ncbi:MAG: APC family permease [Actinomycetales bacterium]|nr:APC family permease [Candidatus Phosphoribacter baldrii]